MDPAEAVRLCDEFASTQRLRALGVSARDLTSAVRSGSVNRPRIGWYSTASPWDPRHRAVALGGRLTAASALSYWDAWLLDPPGRLHAAVAPGSHRPANLAVDVTLHWVASTSPSPCLVSLPEALTQAALVEPLEVVVPLFDWALHTKRIDSAEFNRILRTLPASTRALGGWVDARSDSLLESVARVRLRLRGWQVRSQVRVGTRGAIDLVIEDHIALELDGREHHEKNFEKDRRKDLQIALEGRHAIRVTYSMLRGDWPRIERAVERALGARRGGDVGGSGVVPKQLRGRRRSKGHARDNSASANVVREYPPNPRGLHST